MQSSTETRALLTGIVGSEDYLSSGVAGSVTVDGPLADAIFEQVGNPAPDGPGPFCGGIQVVRAHSLSIRGRGITVIGPAVRNIVHTALRAVAAQPAAG